MDTENKKRNVLGIKITFPIYFAYNNKINNILNKKV